MPLPTRATVGVEDVAAGRVPGELDEPWRDRGALVDGEQPAEAQAADRLLVVDRAAGPVRLGGRRGPCRELGGGELAARLVDEVAHQAGGLGPARARSHGRLGRFGHLAARVDHGDVAKARLGGRRPVPGVAVGAEDGALGQGGQGVGRFDVLAAVRCCGAGRQAAERQGEGPLAVCRPSRDRRRRAQHGRIDGAGTPDADMQHDAAVGAWSRHALAKLALEALRLEVLPRHLGGAFDRLADAVGGDGDGEGVGAADGGDGAELHGARRLRVGEASGRGGVRVSGYGATTGPR